ncbi:hypothetical protein CHH80_13835 [Bacillus sp. 7504-2]|nr:hypothetical protein CHH80_13835 [Bacillus sp. 7504-2]
MSLTSMIRKGTRYEKAQSMPFLQLVMIIIINYIFIIMPFKENVNKISKIFFMCLVKQNC